MRLHERSTQLRRQQVDQVPHNPTHRRKHHGTLAMHVHLDVMLDLKHLHVPMRAAVKPITKVIDHKGRHIVELLSSER